MDTGAFRIVNGSCTEFNEVASMDQTLRQQNVCPELIDVALPCVYDSAASLVPPLGLMVSLITVTLAAIFIL